MIYQNVVSAVVRALASEVINSAGGCSFEPRVQAERISGEISGKEASILFDFMVHARLHSQLSAEHWDALNAKYSTCLKRKHDSMMAMARRVKSPASARFIECATATWAFPKVQGADGKRSTCVLPSSWYEISRWDDEGRPEPTLYRWRSAIRRALDDRVNEALVCAQEILDSEGLLSEAA